MYLPGRLASPLHSDDRCMNGTRPKAAGIRVAKDVVSDHAGGCVGKVDRPKIGDNPVEPLAELFKVHAPMIARPAG